MKKLTYNSISRRAILSFFAPSIVFCMMILYRILGFIVTILSSFLAMATLYGIFMAAANPGVLFQCFLLAGVVVYSWLANRFFARVILMKLTMTKKQKDWLQVNAIVAFVFSVLGIAGCIAILMDPSQLKEMLKAFPDGDKVNDSIIMNTAYFLVFILGALFIHIIWTYLLIRKNKDRIETQ